MGETKIVSRGEVAEANFFGGLGGKVLRLFQHNINNGQADHQLLRATLPASVRYAMQYRGAELTAPEVEILYKSGIPRAAFYLAIKAADSQPPAQAEMLNRLATVGFDYAKLSIDDIKLGTELLQSSNGHKKTVAGEKLGQFSRHGFTGDVEAFDRTLGSTMAKRSTTSLFMVANYPYIAVDVLARHSLERGQALGVINPDRLSQTELPVGFTMKGIGQDFKISHLYHDYILPMDTVIFDDVIRQGKTRETVLAWAGKSAISPDFIAAVRVPQLV